MNSSKAAKPASPSAKLVGDIQLARLRLTKAETGVKSAKEQSRAAKRRRKEAKQAARRAKKQLKQAKAEFAEATQALADAESNLARANAHAALARKRVQARPVPRAQTSRKRKSAATRLRRRPSAPVSVAANPPMPKPAEITPPAPAPADAVLGSREHPVAVPRDWEVRPVTAPSQPASLAEPPAPPQSDDSSLPQDQH